MRQSKFLTTLAVALATLASCSNEPAMELRDDGSPDKAALPETKDQALVAKSAQAATILCLMPSMLKYLNKF